MPPISGEPGRDKVLPFAVTTSCAMPTLEPDKLTVQSSTKPALSPVQLAGKLFAP